MTDSLRKCAHSTGRFLVSLHWIAMRVWRDYDGYSQTTTNHKQTFVKRALLSWHLPKLFCSSQQPKHTEDCFDMVAAVIIKPIVNGSALKMGITLCIWCLWHTLQFVFGWLQMCMLFFRRKLLPFQSPLCHHKNFLNNCHVQSRFDLKQITLWNC